MATVRQWLIATYVHSITILYVVCGCERPRGWPACLGSGSLCLVARLYGRSDTQTNSLLTPVQLVTGLPPLTCGAVGGREGIDRLQNWRPIPTGQSSEKGQDTECSCGCLLKPGRVWTEVSGSARGTARELVKPS